MNFRIGPWCRRICRSRGLLRVRRFLAAWPTAFVVGHILLLMLAAGQPALGLVEFDFEQKYYVHPGHQVWDFCLARFDSLYHVFYGSIPDGPTSSATLSDTVWHATSPDLYEWDLLGPTITVGPDAFDAEAIWAPEVVYDPERVRWVMIYTGVDSIKVQRPCLAFSYELQYWHKSIFNPVFEPDTTLYSWSPTQAWSAFRDPFIFRQDDRWHILNTAHLRNGEGKIGIVHHASSLDLVTWADLGPFYTHNGSSDRWHALESSQYHERDGLHHLFFAEEYIPGTSHLSSDTQGGWDMEDWHLLERGAAPEIDAFDGVEIFSRIGISRHPISQNLLYVARFDTLHFEPGNPDPVIYKPHPLARNWVAWSGVSMNANPVHRDNQAARGEAPCGLVGNGWFSSREAYQGPLSDYQLIGTEVGDGAVGDLQSRTFTVTGHSLRFLIGGGHYPETCYLAVMDAATDTMLASVTGQDNATMVWRDLDLSPYIGRDVYLHIVDQETGPMGYISLDEIQEREEGASAVSGPLPTTLIDHGPRPNPANPLVAIAFTLPRDAVVEVVVHDVRGSRIWQSGARRMTAGGRVVTWTGRDLAGKQTAAGIYMYRILMDGRPMADGKVTLVR